MQIRQSNPVCYRHERGTSLVARLLAPLLLAWLVFCGMPAALAATPAHQESVADTLPAGSLRELITTAPLSVAASQLDWALIRDFYEGRDFAPVWTDGNKLRHEAWVAIDRLARAVADREHDTIEGNADRAPGLGLERDGRLDTVRHLDDRGRRDQRDHRVRRFRIELGAVRPFEVGDVARELDHRNLHPKADAQVRNAVLAGITGGLDLAFDAPLAEAQIARSRTNLETLNHEADRIRQALADKVEPYALPRRIVTVDKIPMSAAGKYDRQAAAELFEKG